MFLPKKTSRLRLNEAENARRNRLEILKALSQGQITRRELIKWGLFTAGGILVSKHGLSPFVASAYADSNIPTGLPLSPLFGVQDFSTPMPRFDGVSNTGPHTTKSAPAAAARRTSSEEWVDTATRSREPTLARTMSASSDRVVR